jgi:hypothetical protein
MPQLFSSLPSWAVENRQSGSNNCESIAVLPKRGEGRLHNGATMAIAIHLSATTNGAEIQR